MKKILFTLLAIIILIAGFFLITKNAVKTTTIPTGRLTYTGDGVEFSYPATFGANVWRAVTRPPKFTVVPANEDPIALGCPMLKDSAIIHESGAGKANGIHYTFLQGDDVGAGSRYTSTCYIFSGSNVNYVFDFEIQSHNGCGDGQCGAYCGTQFEQECKDLDRINTIEKPIERIISTFTIKK